MNLSLRKAATLLVAGLAFAACSTESNDSPLTPPLGEQVLPAQDIEVRVCKVYRDLDAAGDYDFDVSVDGGDATTINLTAGNGIGANPLLGCTGDAVEAINITRGSTLNIVELAAAAGLAELESISIVPFPNCSAANDLANGETEILFDETNCVEGSYLVTFKNLSLDDPPGGGEGCTPGAWRNQDGTGKNGKNRWDNTPYTATGPGATLFEDAMNYDFPADSPYDGITLRQALDYNANSGGEALIKHAAAALLNASVDDELLDYEYSVGMVQQMFADAWDDLEGDNNETKDAFDEANNAGCTI